MINEFKDKVILVTGGAGSIGSSLVRDILKFEPKTVRVFDLHEFSLHNLEKSFSAEDLKRVRFLLGDVRDRDRLNRATNGVDIVYHAAAHKHVHLCEYNPFEAVKTNILGTQNAIDAALHNNVKKFVFISTDKAANPIGTLGASKLLGEKITTAANNYRGESPTMFSSVRFGNVTMSNGSVIPIFINQIKNDLPITITSSKMTRFLMPLQEAVHLIFKATESMQGGEVFVLKMKSVNMEDLARGLVDEFNAVNKETIKKVKIQKIGRRPGEKIHEELLVEEESGRVVEHDDMIVILPSVNFAGGEDSNINPQLKKINPSKYSSDYKPMSKKQLQEFLRGHNIFEYKNL